ncbi:MAG: RidA family protein [Gemmatimonadetes bacterium]|nr:RidA family protein [Gemmatimonadota bacterium]NIQ60181.1 RidA family protein [Gemmatimonadota bacterium]NIU80398.1 RidA family protein [Gammaproteobacteria bacterium]NIX48741.1 RidA family protein [Gemmatimonadota bacterium]NIY13199.1 RidA family protein [Gemmatimonadota bacterium]
MAERRRVPTTAPWAEKVGYSRAIRVGDTIYVSGTAPVDDDGGIAHPGDLYAQAKRCLDLIVAALGEAGARPEHVVRTRIYVRDAGQWEEVGRAHAEVLGHAKPATTLVEVAGFVDPEILVEIEAIAVV